MQNRKRHYINVLNTILLTLKGKIIFNRFGFNAPKEVKYKNASAKLLSVFNEWQFNAKSNDWENTTKGALLSGYTLPSILKALLKII